MTTTTHHDRRVASADGSEVLVFLETAAETDGARTSLRADLAPGSGTPLHTHGSYGEDFEVLEGTLRVVVDGRTLDLGPGERAFVPIGAVHRFVNATTDPVRFRCALLPASRGFEEGQQIAAGLEAEGRMRGDLPRDPRHLGLLMELTDSALAGPGRVINPLLRLTGAVGRRQGLLEDLRERHVRW